MMTLFKRRKQPRGLRGDLLPRLPEVIEQSGDLIFITNRQGLIVYANPAFERHTGYRREQVMGARPNLLKSGEHDITFYTRLWEQITRGDSFEALFTNRRRDGSLFYEQKTISPLRDDRGHITHFVSSGKDVTAQMQSRLHLLRLSRRHPVSGLPNLSVLHERLERLVARCQRSRRQGAMVLLGLDRFAAVNAAHGRDVGDHLLVAVAGRLRGLVKETDALAHLGGDRFAVLLEDLSSVAAAEAATEGLLAALREPFELLEERLQLGCSAGVVVLPINEVRVPELMRHAEMALGQAKAAGGDRMQVFNADLEGLRERERGLLERLRAARQRQEFVIHYQPIVRLEDRLTVGVEALLRWEPEHGDSLPPAALVAELERMGLMVEITEWLLGAAAMQVRVMSESLGRELFLSVNLANGCLAQGGLCDVVSTLLERRLISPHQLQLELTEQLIVDNLEVAATMLRTLKNLGVAVSVDDYGSGYSSITYLQRFAIDRLKIDRDFVRGLTHSNGDARLVQGIIGLSRGLGIEVTAEGVETEEQAARLLAAGCPLAQGYLFAHPMPYAALMREIR